MEQSSSKAKFTRFLLDALKLRSVPVCGPTLPAHPFLASSPCQRAEELSSFGQQVRPASPPSRSHRTPSFRGGRLISERPARRQPLFLQHLVFRSTRRRRSPPPISFPVSADRSVSAGPVFYLSAGAPSISFFCTAEVFSATSGEDHLRFTSRHLDDYFVASAGPVFYLDAGAPSTSFFAPPKFFQRQTEKITSALLPVDLTNTSSHQRGAVSTSAPPRRQPLFSSRRNFRPDTSAKPLPPSAPPPSRSLRPSGRPVCSPGQPARQPLFYRLVTMPCGCGRNLRIFPSPKPGKGKNALSSIH